MLKFDWNGEQLTTKEIMTLLNIDASSNQAVKRHRIRLKKLQAEGVDLAKAFDEDYWHERKALQRERNLAKAKLKQAKDLLHEPDPEPNPDPSVNNAIDSLTALIDILRQARKRIQDADARIATLEREYVHARKLWVTAMHEIERLRDVINSERGYDNNYA